MSAEQSNSTRDNPLDPSPDEFWADYRERLQLLAQPQPATLKSPGQRKQWFDSVSRQIDAYLRTPSFLQLMKAHVASLTKPQGAGDRSERIQALDKHLRVTEYALAEVLKQPELETPNESDWRSCDRAGSGHATAIPLEQGAGTRSPGVTAHEVVYESGSLRLLRYKSTASRRCAEPLVICYALVNRPSILDLQRDRSVVRRLTERGFDVYLIDWGVPADDESHLRLQDYVCDRLRGAVDRVCRLADVPRVNLLGYCMGGTLATMFTALDSDRINSLTLMAAPIDFGRGSGLLNLWAASDYFDVDEFVDTYGNCPGEFLRHCFAMMQPLRNYTEKYLSLYENLDDSAFVGSFLAMERWANDTIPVAGETFREYVKALYQQNRLVKGELDLAERRVSLQSITCPLLLLVAEQDHLVPPASTLALREYVQSKEVTCLSVRSGHIGLAVGSRAHSELWPRATEWIASQSGPSGRHPMAKTRTPR